MDVDFHNVGTFHDGSNGGYWKPVFQVDHKCMLPQELNDWRQDALEAFWEENAEFKVVPTSKEDVTAMVTMCKDFANKPTHKFKRDYSRSIAVKKNEDELLDALPRAE